MIIYQSLDFQQSGVTKDRHTFLTLKQGTSFLVQRNFTDQSASKRNCWNDEKDTYILIFVPQFLIPSYT